MKRITIAILAILFFNMAFAQDKGRKALGEGTVFEAWPQALGAFVAIPGTDRTLGGLSWQGWFGRLGLQAALGGMYDELGNYNYSLSGETSYMVYGEDFAEWLSGALYGNLLISHSGQNDGMTGAYSPAGHLGLGIGMELVVFRHFSTNLEFMYVGSFPWALHFGLGAGLRYRF